MTCVRLLVILCLTMPLWAAPAHADEGTESLREEIRFLRKRLEQLEGKLEAMEKREQPPPPIASADMASADSAENSEDSILQVVRDRVTLSGVVEVEAGYASLRPDDGDDSGESDIVLATVEVGLTAQLLEQLKAELLFLWEEDDTEPVDLDEGYIVFGGAGEVPVFVQAGRYYIPFGRDESNFITDPPTLEMYETNESSVLLGYTNPWFSAALGAFKGDVDSGGGEDINSAYAELAFRLPEQVGSPFQVEAGLGWLSNIADSDVFTDDLLTSSELDDIVGAWSAFLTASWRDIRLFAEYVAALDDFEEGVFLFNPECRSRPTTWNVELAYDIGQFTLASSYAGSRDFFGGLDDVDDFPSRRLGVVLSYAFWEYTTVSLEYLNDLFENEDRRDSLTSQVAVEF